MIIYHLKDQSELESRNWLKIKKIQNFDGDGNTKSNAPFKWNDN